MSSIDTYSSTKDLVFDEWVSSHRSDETRIYVYFDGHFFMCPLKYEDETILDLRLPKSKRLSFKEMNDLLLDETKEDTWKWFYCKPKCTLEEDLTILKNDRDIEKMFEVANLQRALDLYVCTIPQVMKRHNDANTMSFKEIVGWKKEELHFSKTQEMDNVEEKTTRIRIPGPAGIFQTDRIRKLRNFKDDPTQEYIRQHNFDDVSEDDDFQCSPWVKALEFMNNRGEIEGGCFSNIKSYIKKGKLEAVVAIITSCKPNVLGDMNVTLKDPSGTTSDTIHYKVLSSEDGYAKDIKVGSALILRNVSVFCNKSKNYALNITIKNLVKIIKKDTVVEDADGASSRKI
nr:hypothetical protein [Tanacetum cinerariifolium]